MNDKLNNREIPDGWGKVELRDILKYEQPYKYSVESTDYEKSGVPVLTAGKSFILGHTSENKGVYKNLPVIIFDDFTTDSKFVNFPFKVKSSAMKFLKEKQDEKISLKLLFEIINNLKLSSIGGDHKRRWISDFSKRKVLLPKSLTEQKKIAEILSKVDTAMEQTQSLIAKYRCIKTGLMQDLLTKGIDEDGNIRSEESHEFKDSKLGRIPKEWEVVNLKEIGSKRSPYLKTGPFGSALKIEHWKEQGIPVVTIGSLGDNHFITENLLYISSEKANELSSYKLHEGDILFSRVADIGRSLVIKKEQHNWIMSSNFMRLRLDKDSYNSEFLQLIIKYSFQFKKQVSENVNESGRSVTNSKTLNEFMFPKFDLNEQLRIIKKVNSMDNQSDFLLLNKSKLQSLKTALMQDLLSGKKRVTNLIKEEAL